MDQVDDAWLADYNKHVDRGDAEQKLTEDQFEELMWCLEKLTDLKNPWDMYSRAPSVLQPELPTLAEYEAQLDQDQPLLPPSRSNINLPSLKPSAPKIYQHWWDRRKQRGGKPIAPCIKTEEIPTVNDPWVCFRRRNERPQRQRRRADQSGVDKLRQLRTQLDQARQLLDMSTKRERLRKESLILEELIFQQRVLIRRMRKKLGLPVRPPQEDPRKRRKLEDDRYVKLPCANYYSGVPGKIVIPIEQLKQWAIPPPPNDANATARREAFDQDWNNGIVDFTEPSAMPIPIHVTAGHEYYRCNLPVPVPIGLPSPPTSLDENWARDGELAPNSAYLHVPLGRVRMGRGGRRVYDRRLRLDQVFPEARVDHHWRAGEREGARDKVDGFTPGVEPLTPAEVEHRRQVEKIVDRLRWACESDEEDDAIVDEALTQSFEDSSPLLIFRAGMLRASEDYVRLFSQSREWLGTLVNITPPDMRYPQSRIPPPIVTRPNLPVNAAATAAVALQQQLQAVGSNLGAVAQIHQQMRQKEEDDVNNPMRNVLNAANKGAQGIQALTQQINQQQRPLSRPPGPALQSVSTIQSPTLPAANQPQTLALLQQLIRNNQPGGAPKIQDMLQQRAQTQMRPPAVRTSPVIPNLQQPIISSLSPAQIQALSTQLNRLSQTQTPSPSRPNIPANIAALLQNLQQQTNSPAAQQQLTAAILAATQAQQQQEDKK